jgi:hypothetical protein
MTWPDIYLISFLLGFSLSVLALLAGSVHLHLPHLHLHHGLHLPHAHGGGGHTSSLPWFNMFTLAAFLAWFGGIGYLLQSYYRVWYLTALGVAVLAGIGGAAVVFLFVARILMRHDMSLDPADFEMVGVLGKLSLPIRENGTGEIVYSQEGVRRVTGARSDDGRPIPKGCEVVVTRYEKGLAFVRRWDELTGESASEYEQHLS